MLGIDQALKLQGTNKITKTPTKHKCQLLGINEAIQTSREYKLITKTCKVDIWL